MFRPLFTTFGRKDFFFSFSLSPPLSTRQTFLCKWSRRCKESDSLWATLHIPSHHCVRQHNPISGWWAEKVGSLPGRRFHDSQPPKVMRFSANSMKSGLNFGSKRDNSCLRSISRMVDGNALILHLAENHVTWRLRFCDGANGDLEAAAGLTFFFFSSKDQKMVDLNTWL